MEFSARNIVIFWYTLYETQPAEAEENVENVAMLSNIREIHERKRHLALFAIVNIKAPFYKFIIWNCCYCCCWTRAHVCILKDIRSHTIYIYIYWYMHTCTHIHELSWPNIVFNIWYVRIEWEFIFVSNGACQSSVYTCVRVWRHLCRCFSCMALCVSVYVEAPRGR